jgi:hypothetical protein
VAQKFALVSAELSAALSIAGSAGAAQPVGQKLAQLERFALPSEQLMLPKVDHNRRHGPPVACQLGIGAAPQGEGAGYFDGMKMIGSASCSYEIVKGLDVGVTLLVRPKPSQQREWDPDFSWHASYRVSQRISIEYGDYKGNRWNDLRAGTLFDGTLALTYGLPTPKRWQGPDALLRSLNCSVSASVPLKPDPGDSRLRFSMSCGISPFKRLDIRATATVYAAGMQNPWDPDFTYTAAYRVTPRLSVGYANYAGNRWFWRNGKNAGGGRGASGIGAGALSVSYKVF